MSCRVIYNSDQFIRFIRIYRFKKLLLQITEPESYPTTHYFTHSQVLTTKLPEVYLLSIT